MDGTTERKRARDGSSSARRLIRDGGGRLMRCVAPIVGLLSQGLARVGVRNNAVFGCPCSLGHFSLNLRYSSTCLLPYLPLLWPGACSLPWGISILSPLFVFFILLVILPTLPLNYPKSPLARTPPAQHIHTEVSQISSLSGLQQGYPC